MRRSTRLDWVVTGGKRKQKPPVLSRDTGAYYTARLIRHPLGESNPWKKPREKWVLRQEVVQNPVQSAPRPPTTTTPTSRPAGHRFPIVWSLKS